MATPRLITQAQSASSAAGTSFTATLPGSIGTTQNNVLFAIVAIDGAQSSVAASGWTLLGRTVYSSGSLSSTLAVLMKAAGSTNTCTITYPTSAFIAVSILQYADCSTSESTTIWAGLAVTGGTTADPPAASAEISFSSYLPLACISMANASVTISSYPSNCSGGFTVAASTGNTGQRLGIATGPVVTKSFDPNVFTLSTTNAGVVGTLLICGVSGSGTGTSARKRGSFNHLVGAA